MKFNLARVIKTLIPIILVGIIGNLVFTIYTSDQNLLATILQFQPGLFLVAVALAILPWFGHALRTVIWSRFLKSPVSFKNSLRICLAHELGGAITPTVVGGTPIKLGLLMANKVPAGSAGMIVVLQVLEDLVFVLSSLPLAIYFAGGWNNPALDSLRESANHLAGHLWWIVPGLVLAMIVMRSVYTRQKEKRQKSTKMSFWNRSG